MTSEARAVPGGVRETAAHVQGGRRTAVAATEEALGRIESRDRSVRAFIEVTSAAALDEARSVDERIAAGERLPLAGVPLAIKDNLWIAGRDTTCAHTCNAGSRAARSGEVRAYNPSSWVRYAPLRTIVRTANPAGQSPVSTSATASKYVLPPAVTRT